jgi:hypothetical protein
MRSLLVAGLLACAACGDAPPPAAPPPAEVLDPTQTLQRFYDALAAGDLDAARAYMLPLTDPELRRRQEADLVTVVELFGSGGLSLQAQ